MKEYIDTAPVIEAYKAGDECPFCYMQRQAEQRAIRYVVGPCASYMEPEIRAITDNAGFCADHLKKLYDYGNPLGSALMMQTHLVEMIRELDGQIDQFSIPDKRRIFKKPEAPSLLGWLQRRNHSCYLCSRVENTMARYYATFYALLKEQDFRNMVENSKGICFHHFEQLLAAASEHLPNDRREWFYSVMPKLFRENLARIQGDLDWFIAKHDYRNAGADWKNSQDAVSRTMQKLQGGYPADPAFKKE